MIIFQSIISKQNIIVKISCMKHMKQEYSLEFNQELPASVLITSVQGGLVLAYVQCLECLEKWDTAGRLAQYLDVVPSGFLFLRIDRNDFSLGLSFAYDAHRILW